MAAPDLWFKCLLMYFASVLNPAFPCNLFNCAFSAAVALVMVLAALTCETVPSIFKVVFEVWMSPKIAPCEKGKKLTTMHNAISSEYRECRLIVPPPCLKALKMAFYRLW